MKQNGMKQKKKKKKIRTPTNTTPNPTTSDRVVNNKTHPVEQRKQLHRVQDNMR